MEATKVTPDNAMPIVPGGGSALGSLLVPAAGGGGKAHTFNAKEKWDVRNLEVSRIPIATTAEAQAPSYYDAKCRPHPEVLEDVGTITTLRPGKDSLSREEREALAKEKAKRSCFGTVYKLEVKDPWVAMRESLEFKHLNKSKVEDKHEKSAAEHEKDRKLLHAQMSEEEKRLTKARERRVTSFQAAADEAIGKFGAGDDMAPISSLLQPDDELVQTIHVVEISGMPSTTDFIVISGAIEVALVRDKPSVAPHVGGAALREDDARLLFSVSRGLSNISVAEEFSYQRLEATGCMACCFPPSCINCCCPCFLNGDFFMDYEIQHDFTSQFFILPVAPCVIDAMAFKETNKSFTASSQAKKPQGCSCYCIDWTACCACCCACCPAGCCNCGEPTRIAPVLFLDAYATQASTSLATEEKKDLVSKSVVDGLEWSVEMRGTSDIFVVMHYVSTLNGSTETCSMRLDKTRTSFSDAKQFVANVGRHRARVQHNNVLASALPGFTKALSAGHGNTGPGGRPLRAQKPKASLSPLEMCCECSYSSSYYSLCLCLCPTLLPLERPLPYGPGCLWKQRLVKRLSGESSAVFRAVRGASGAAHAAGFSFVSLLDPSFWAKMVGLIPLPK